MRLALCSIALLAAACSSTGGAGGAESPDATAEATANEELFPDVVEAVVTAEPGGTYRIDATLSSPYDTADRYADGWRVMTPDGDVLAVRVLAHDHRGEQPFTRSLAGVEIPAGVREVIVEGRDQVSEWGGATVTAPVPEQRN